MVIDMYPNSPAAKAGVHEASQQIRLGFRPFPVGGDVILAIQGKTVNAIPELQTEVYRYKPGDKITVTVLRNNRKLDIPVTLEEPPRQ